MSSQIYSVHNTKSYEDYGRYFYDVVAEFVGLEPYRCAISLNKKYRGQTTQIMLRSDDEPTLRGLCQAIDADIGLAPYQFSISVPEKYLGEEGCIGDGMGVFSRLDALIENIDYVMHADADSSNVILAFNRAFHRAKIEQGLYESLKDDEQRAEALPEGMMARNVFSLDAMKRARKLFSEDPVCRYQNFRPTYNSSTILQLLRPR